MASQTITGPELQYTQDNKRCYAYSGAVLCDDTGGGVSLLEFTTGSGTIAGRFQFNYAQEVNEKFEFNIKLNSSSVQEYLQNSSDDPAASSPHNLIPIIIPPFTLVQATAQNKSGSDGRAMIVSFTGRVYEYLKVRN